MRRPRTPHSQVGPARSDPEASASPPQPKQKLLLTMRANLRLRHFSPRTEEAYLGWVVRYVRFHALRHPVLMGEAEVIQFLSYLATERRAAPSTLNQALAALGFLYREILRRPLPIGSVIPRPNGPVRLPVVLTVSEVRRVLAELRGVYHLVGLLLYGSGLRLMECLTLRIKDVDIERGEVRIRRGKGAKDRVTVLAAAAGPALQAQIELVRVRHQ